mmetsp:Transcript_24461/g.56867  ORF Transcript_24461/g.56867 Transcript_24461/m.56867 type:complete len:266 (-) Transcript_24461:647-1444(-)
MLAPVFDECGRATSQAELWPVSIEIFLLLHQQRLHVLVLDQATQLQGRLSHLPHYSRMQVLLGAELSGCIFALRAMDALILLVQHRQQEVVGVLSRARESIYQRPRHVASAVIQEVWLIEGHARTEQRHRRPQVKEPMPHQQSHAHPGAQRQARQCTAEVREPIIGVHSTNEPQFIHGTRHSFLSRWIQAGAQDIGRLAKGKRFDEEACLSERRSDQFWWYFVLEFAFIESLCTKSEAHTILGSASSTFALLKIYSPGPCHLVDR